MTQARSPKQYTGVRPINPPNVIYADRSPVSTDTAYVKGDLWEDLTGLATWQYAGGGVWIALGTGAVGGVVTLTGNSGGPRSPTAGNINIVGGSGVTVSGAASTLTIALTGGGTAIDSFAPDAGTNPVVPNGSGLVTMAGTANQITTTGGLNLLTFSVPSTFIAPGTIASTTSITSGTTLVATTTVTAGTGITSTTGNIVATAGAVNAGTSMTATAGDITATLGNVIINGAAKQLRVHGGAVTDFIGTAILVNGTVTVANTNIATTDRIFVTRSAVNASTALGVFKVVKTATTNFVVTACKPADATTETGDVSTVEYFIVRQV